ncbi:MAG: hypothetical protein KGH57_04260 [Candidatus Micrarchaeota archaeon]|nr:hypothetical protein [Candidatus Micrarchaeota archaeon]
MLAKKTIQSAFAFLTVSAMIAVTLIAIFSPAALVFASTTNTFNGITTKVQVSGVCVPLITNTVINFGSVQPGFSASTSNAEKVTDSGSVSTNILLYSDSGVALSGNWQDGGVGNFLVGNTLWDGQTHAANNGNQLTNSITADTQIFVPVGTSANLFFGLNVPTGQVPGTYTQGITVTFSC